MDSIIKFIVLSVVLGLLLSMLIAPYAQRWYLDNVDKRNPDKWDKMGYS